MQSAYLFASSSGIVVGVPSYCSRKKKYLQLLGTEKATAGITMAKAKHAQERGEMKKKIVRTMNGEGMDLEEWNKNQIYCYSFTLLLCFSSASFVLLIILFPIGMALRCSEKERKTLTGNRKLIMLCAFRRLFIDLFGVGV